jgi:hypothetical protein
MGLKFVGSCRGSSSTKQARNCKSKGWNKNSSHEKAEAKDFKKNGKFESTYTSKRHAGQSQSQSCTKQSQQKEEAMMH